MNRYFFIILVFFVFFSFEATELKAQTGGRYNFSFLNNISNARIAGLGGNVASLRDFDPNMCFANPASLNYKMKKNLAMNFNSFYAGIQNMSTLYTDSISGVGNFFGGIQYVNYGNMDQTDVFGNDIGTFQSSDFAVSSGISKTLGAYTLGGTFKIVGSTIGPFSAYGVAIDIGSNYQHPTLDFNAGLVIRNLGFAFKKFNDNSTVNMPLNVELGLNYKLKHMPLRFIVTAHTLNIADAQYADPNSPVVLPTAGNNNKKREKKISEQIMRHFTFGGEFVLSKNFFLRMGYNHQRRKEMRSETNTNWAGFSGGFMFRIKSFEFAFTRASFHSIGASSYISLTTNFSTLFKKTKEVNINPINE